MSVGASDSSSRDHRLAAQVPRCVRGEVPEPAKRIADSGSGVGEADRRGPGAADAAGTPAASPRRSCPRRREGPTAARDSHPGWRGPPCQSGVTSSAPTRLSQVRPYWAVRWPIPPPRVSPATPVEPTTPPGVTRPKRWVAASKSSHARTAVGAGGPGVAVDVDPAHQRQIDHQAALADAMPGGVVPTSAYGDLQRVRPGEVKGPRHVVGIEATHDHGRPAVDQRVEAAARRIEPLVRGGEHGAAKRSPQLGQAVNGAGRIDRFTHVNIPSHPGSGLGVCIWKTGPAPDAQAPGQPPGGSSRAWRTPPA